MTEEDTFNKLRRTPFGDIRRVVRQSNRLGISKRVIVKILQRAGWSISDYNIELAKTVNELAKEMNK